MSEKPKCIVKCEYCGFEMIVDYERKEHWFYPIFCSDECWTCATVPPEAFDEIAAGVA